jgi:hypothetical protein
MALYSCSSLIPVIAMPAEIIFASLVVVTLLNLLALVKSPVKLLSAIFSLLDCVVDAFHHPGLLYTAVLAA